jgi:Spy/CpxP family protein refolding chaperone
MHVSITTPQPPRGTRRTALTRWGGKRTTVAVLVQVAALSALVLPVSVYASQTSRHKWWQDADVRTELGLTPQQSGELEQIFQSMMPRFKAAKEDLQREEKVLSRLVEESKDEVAVSQQIDRVEAARSELSKARTLMTFRMHRVLSPDQRARLKTVYERNSRARRERRKDEKN